MLRMRTLSCAGRSFPPVAISILTDHKPSRRSDRLFCPSFNRFVDSVIAIHGAGQGKRQRSARGFPDGRQASKTTFAGVTREVIENNESDVRSVSMMLMRGGCSCCSCWASRFRGQRRLDGRRMPLFSYDHQSRKTKLAGITREVVENNGKRYQARVSTRTSIPSSPFGCGQAKRRRSALRFSRSSSSERNGICRNNPRSY